MNSLPQSSASALLSRLIKAKPRKQKPSEEVIALSNSFSAIAHLEVDVKDLNEDNVVDTAPGTEEEDSIPRHL
ncbi:hypothetical protein TNCV_3261731 [Trichonephila clavipes]|nr:hypothetical protein TNCV_3261731 [Trichonephila clavipes]